ncbi:GNAT family N-acetyltransferase [Pseudonocardia phyllosphaerae]|uniref:GNAT family N-acetyltransferase n=1 Tax=Pseudonocardia phyllosphaerae TaxID=3390502 RepID=UPI00397C8445
MSEIEVRPAIPGDIDDVLALWAEAAENADRPVDRHEAVARLLERDPEALLLAVDPRGAVVGTVIAGWDGWRAHLYRLAVHPGRRRQGIATTLLDAAADRLVALGAMRLDAMVLEGNADGQRLWERAGFVRQDGWRRWVR